MWISLILGNLLTVLDAVVKNPSKKEQFKSVLLQAAAIIVEHYGQPAVDAAVASRAKN